ncbi:phosphatidylinositol 4-phosphate 5-kinase 5-like [Odontomachus brunneus]|uniref:phosphatidylinositol 4-phosphate 5-kinase 5-like n=1 Tax=Odontomachus brunneus TaxID=486640 RepID=UPI0013F28F3C|nr:phosphatidylinositol 4-phosphate 5-kinase 5-like [Odontomachus brunneus]
MKRDTPRDPKSRSDKSDKTRRRIGVGKFTFRNGDSYEGKYEVNVGERALVKQDEGVYVTDNFDVYEGKWNVDGFASENFHIRYNNDVQYKGHVAANGAMDGMGTYIFPDGSSLAAVWSRNRPVSDVVYKEPLGQEWMVESVSESVSIEMKPQKYRSNVAFLYYINLQYFLV